MPATLTPLQGALLDWFSVNGRHDLPWRRTRDAWSVLVSELMLQQTQVSRVVPRYLAFLNRFPTLRSCAEAPVADVVRLWAGLGYNRRAVNLHRLALACVESHGGSLPDDLDALLALPGIGPYTARAILAFAHEHHVAVVDTNAARVVARVGGRPYDAGGAQAAADALVPTARAWEWNQAILDLGATVCTKRRVACGACPLIEHCAWRVTGNPEPDPAATTAGTGGVQSPFGGSDRQGRGRLVDALRAGAVARSDLAAVMGWPGDEARAQRVADAVVADGLAVVDGTSLRLP